MTCSHQKRELKCKFPPCPCQKCAQSHSQNSGLPNRCCRDTPPERPLPKYQFQPKCPGKLETIGPSYQRKYPPTETKSTSGCCEEKKTECVEPDDCYTGLGCCNTERNFIAFFINLIGYMAFVVITVMVFWLIVCHWVVILGFKIYQAKRTTRIAVVSIIGLLLLLTFCTAGWRSHKKGSAHRAVTTTDVALIPSQSSSMFSFKWRRSKQDEPAQIESRSWFASLKWRKPKEDEVTTPPASSSGWMPAFKWRKTTTKVIEHPPPKGRSSWMPSFLARGEATKTKEIETTTRTSWISWRKSTPTQTPATEAETRGSWLPSFKWGHGTQKVNEEPPEVRSSWIPWRRPSTVVQTHETTVTRSSWLPSMKWGRKATAPTVTTEEVRSTWTSYFTRQKAPQASELAPESRATWTSYLGWRKTAPVGIEKQSKESDKRFSWFYSFKWGRTKETDTTSVISDGRPISWLPSFNCARSQDLQISHTKAEKSSSWLPSFKWGRQSASPQSGRCTTSGCNAKSACELRQHKVTVSVEDPEAQRIFKQSKMFAIPSEMKHPPKLVVFLRDHLFQSSA